MALIRNRVFLEGIALGGLCGVVVGSVLALQANEENIVSMKRFVQKMLRKQQKINFELLFQ